MTVLGGDAGHAPAARGPVPSALRAIDAVLRGVGQVMLQDNRCTGALFLAGIFWNSWRFGVAAVLGTAASTAVARLWVDDRNAVRAGVYGFNGALVGIAMLYFLRPDALTWVCVVFAAACSTPVMSGLSAFLRRFDVGAFTAPFVLVAWCFFLATARFGRLHATALLPAAGLPEGTAVEGVVQVGTLVDGLFKGVAQVFFQDNLITGILFTLGLFVASWRAGGAALVGSALGLVVAWGMGAAEPALRGGAYGFNNVLVAIALVGAFGVADWRSAGAVLLALLATPFVYAALSAALQPLGLPALTFPFVLVTWVFLLAQRARRPAGPTAAAGSG